MANKEREQLLNEAQNVGLSVGVDFNKNITNEKLKNLIEKKKEELENQLKGNENNSKEPNETKLVPLEEFEEDKDKLEEYGKTLGIDLDKRKDITNMYSDLLNFISNISKEPNETKTYEDEILIKRTSPCGNYRVQIKGIKECARRTSLTAEQVKEALENGKPVNGWNFEEIE